MTILFTLSDNDDLVSRIASQLNAKVGRINHRLFPDGETYLQVLDDVAEQDIIIVNDLHQPNSKTVELILLSHTLKSLGAVSVGLVAPYLAYMRQDKVFHPGEGISSHYYAQLLSDHFDWLVTVDPHLHRIDSLSDIYHIPAHTLHATVPVANWIVQNVEKPLLIGPDSESEQWVKAIGQHANIDFEVLTKVRHGDHDVEVSVPNIEAYLNHTPVLVDDIISTGRTMIETANHLEKAGLKAPVCVAVHAVFAPNAIEQMTASHIGRVVSANSIVHDSNAIDLSELIADFIKSHYSS